MSKNFTIHNGTIHFSIEAAEALGDMAERGKVASIANTLRSEDGDLSIDESKDIAKAMVRNPRQMSYSTGS